MCALFSASAGLFGFTCIRLLFRTDTDDLTGGVRRGEGALVTSQEVGETHRLRCNSLLSGATQAGSERHCPVDLLPKYKSTD